MRMTTTGKIQRTVNMRGHTREIRRRFVGGKCARFRSGIKRQQLLISYYLYR